MQRVQGEGPSAAAATDQEAASVPMGAVCSATTAGGLGRGVGQPAGRGSRWGKSRPFRAVPKPRLAGAACGARLCLGPRNPQVLQLLEEGEANRHVGATRMNEGSSRSHTVFRMVTGVAITG
jgi:hypothetical protein